MCLYLSVLTIGSQASELVIGQDRSLKRQALLDPMDAAAANSAKATALSASMGMDIAKGVRFKMA